MFFFFRKYIPNEFYFRKQFQKDGVHGVFLLFGKGNALPETNISPEKAVLKMMFLFQRWDMLIP